MPTYTYACKSCDSRFDLVQSFTAPDADTCVNCGAQGVRKLPGSIGVTFKGSGFYRTDSRPSANASTSSGSGTGSGSSSSSSTATTGGTTSAS